MYNLWNNKTPFPTFEETKEIKNIEFVNIHTAIKGEYQFLLGAAITKHNGVFYTSWGNSFRGENDDNTILAGKCSYDNGATWENYRRISEKDKGFGRSHGVFLRHNNELYAFAPKAKYDKIDAYPELKMEGYKLVENNWENLGIVLDDYFWPMCEPIRLDNNSLLMAGLKSDSGEAAVALCNGKDLTKWEMKIIPNPDRIDCWGETTVLKQEGKLLAITRSGVDDSCALVSESFDNGLNWSELKKTNFKISIGKMYAGTLSCKNDYLVFSAKDKKYRDSLCIATGKNGFFDKVYTIRHGFDESPRFWKNNEWCYPYAYEDKENNRLYVVYAKNKEDCELAIIPIEALTE